MLTAMIASVLTTNDLLLAPASAIHHANRFGIVVSEFGGVDLILFEFTKLLQDWDCLGTRGYWVFIVALGKNFLSPVSSEEFDEFDSVGFIRS